MATDRSGDRLPRQEGPHSYPYNYAIHKDGLIIDIRYQWTNAPNSEEKRTELHHRPSLAHIMRT